MDAKSAATVEQVGNASDTSPVMKSKKTAEKDKEVLVDVVRQMLVRFVCSWIEWHTVYDTVFPEYWNAGPGSLSRALGHGACLKCGPCLG